MKNNNLCKSRSSRFVLCSSVCILIHLGTQVLAQHNETTLSPHEVIMHLVQDPHGLGWLSQEDQEKLDKVLNNPEQYIEALSQILIVSKNEFDSTDVERIHHIENAVSIAHMLGSEHTGNTMRKLYDNISSIINDHLDGQRAEENYPRNSSESILIRRVIFLRSQTLKVLGDFNDPHAIDSCLRNVESEYRRKTGADLVMLKYLTSVAPLRTDIKTKLNKMYNNPDSPLHKHPQLLRVQKAIDRAEKQKKNESDIQIESHGQRTP